MLGLALYLLLAFAVLADDPSTPDEQQPVLVKREDVVSLLPPAPTITPLTPAVVPTPQIVPPKVSSSQFQQQQQQEQEKSDDSSKATASFGDASSNANELLSADDPWLEDDGSDPKPSKHDMDMALQVEDAHAGKPAIPSAPEMPAVPGGGGSLPNGLPPVPIMMCELMCIGKSHKSCMRPCSYATGCALRAVADQSVLQKLLPRFLEIETETGGSSETLVVPKPQDQAETAEHLQSIPPFDSEEAHKFISWYQSVLSNTAHATESVEQVQKGNMSAEAFEAESKELTTPLIAQMLQNDDLCKHNLLLCILRDKIGHEEVGSFVQTWMSSRMLHSMQTQTTLSHQSTSTEKSTTQFFLSILQIAVRPFCKVMDSWPDRTGPGFCGYYCNLGKSEDCIQICLADHSCCRLWYCLVQRGVGTRNLESCFTESCWSPYPSCEGLKLDYGKLYQALRTGYDQTFTKVNHDPTKLYPFWRPPYRMNGKSLGAIGLSRYDLYPYKDVGWMGGGIGFKGETMAQAVYGY